jgi:tetratricopeptide (TPR) repeat protein
VGGVFISYRGDDSQMAADLIDRELTACFGPDLVFLDWRSIPAGVDFERELWGRLQACSVLLVVIGPHWLSAADEAGGRRIDDPRDWIRQEIVAALAAGLRVIPVLTDGARLPSAAELPADIVGLTRRQYVPLRRRYPEVDLPYLAKRIIEKDLDLARAAAQRAAAGLVPAHLLVTRSAFARPGNVKLNRPKSDFTNRAAEIEKISALLTRNLTDSCPLVVIHGMGGVGKSELANQVAHHLGGVFHQARIRVDLGGGGFPETSTDGALTQILHGFGVFGERVPLDFHERLSLVRDLLASGPCLLLLDDARRVAQVEILLPIMPGSAAVVTSRSPLKALDGAHRVHLEPMLEHDGLLLFDRVRGEQPVPLDRAVGSRIVSLLGGLPLAVRIAAATAVSPPLQRRPLSHLADLLEDDDRRLSLLYDEERAVRGTFDVSYRGLRPDASRFFRCLGLLTASDFEPDLAAYATGVTLDQAGQLLDELAEHQLVEVMHSGVTRYRLHELVRLYARERANQEDPRQQRDTVLRRNVEWYADRVTELMAHPGAQEHPPDNALDWFREEHLNLRSVMRAAHGAGAWELLSRLAGLSYGLFCYRGQWEELAAVQEWAVEAAHARADAPGEIGALIHLAEARRALGKAQETPPLYERALDLARELADAGAEAWVLTHYGDMQCDLERPEKALESYYARALALYREHRDEGAEIWLSAHVSDAWLQLGRPEEAADVGRRALAMSRKRGNAAEATWCQWHLAIALTERGQFEEAQEALAEAIAYHRGARDQAGLATMLLALGRTYLAAGRRDRAREALTQALESARAVGVPFREKEIMNELARASE